MKNTRTSRIRFAINALLVMLACESCGLLTVADASAQPSPTVETASTNRATTVPANDPIARIRDEGLNRSQLMPTMSYLCDVIGPRLTGSPHMKRANEWTREKLESWGLTNAHLEAWGPFGYGWTLERFSIQVTEPHNIPLKAYPGAWSPGFRQPLEAEVIFLEATNTAQLEKYKGKLKGAIVLASPARDVPARFEPLSRRLDVTNLLQLANAAVPLPSSPSPSPLAFRGPGTGGRRLETNALPLADEILVTTNSVRRAASTNAPPTGRRRGGGWSRFLPFLKSEGVALILTPSTTGDAGTIFVAVATVPQPEGETSSATGEGPRAGGFSGRVSAYATNAPTIPAQITVAVEDYNRLVRMSQLGEKLKMAVDLQVQFHTNDLMGYNTIAEIPGSDLKDEIVMVGGHLDSWHSGTGATDNAAGSAVSMEAMRILKALNLQPRRTIRIALWSGEEQGLLGSRAYVTKHFGYYKTNATESASVRSPRDEDTNERPARSNSSRSNRKLVKEDEYDKLSVYFNLDNGAGKIRGIYMQGNEAVRPYFRKWLEPFRDLGAETLTPSNTGSTDHVPFNTVGLPGFEFLQDPLDYWSRTHHSNEDVYERIQPDDLKQAAVIMAAFAYNAAMLDEKLPRKPLRD